MDLTAIFKDDVLRPFTTIVIPGTIATGPYVLLLGGYVPDVQVFWSTHGAAFAVFLAISVVAAGLILDNVGSFIEAKIWDAILDKRSKGAHKKAWEQYLKLRLGDQIVGQRYLHAKVRQMKFELAMAPALLIFDVGLWWLQGLHGMWGTRGILTVSGIIFAGCLYFLWESFGSASILSSTRDLIIESITEGPKGIVP